VTNFGASVGENSPLHSYRRAPCRILCPEVKTPCIFKLYFCAEDFFAHLFGKRMRSTTVFAVEHDPRLIGLSWKNDRTLLICYPSDSRNPAEFKCQPQWEDIKLNALDTRRITASPLAKCHPSSEGCGEGLESVVAKSP
jgi:hypothetical protein